MKRILHGPVSRVHRYIGLLLVVQLLFWTIGGTFMTWVPIAEVRGEHLLKPLEPSTVIIPSALNETLSKRDIVSIRALALSGEQYLRIQPAQGEAYLIDVVLGDTKAVDEAFIRRMARARLRRDVAPISVELLTGKAPIDYRRSMPVWRVSYQSPEGLRLYMSPHTGELMSARTDTWRIFDFFWMLHIMDYETRDNMNNSLVQVFALTASLFVLSGCLMLMFRLRSPKWLRNRKHGKRQS